MSYKMKGSQFYGKSPFKQEGPIDEKQIGLQKSEMEGTWVYDPKKDKTGDKKFVKSERIIDLEDRIGFINEDIFNQDKATPQQTSDKKKLKQELDILRKRKPNK